MDREEIKGKAERAKGWVKDKAGEITNNDELEEEGSAQQDKAANEREVAEHEAKAEAARAAAKSDEAKQRAAEAAK